MKKKFIVTQKVIIGIMFILFLSGYTLKSIYWATEVTYTSLVIDSDSIWFKYDEITGIGYEEGVTRRDPSDIIKVGDYYYIWYTRITAGECLYPSGYCGTLWYASSTDGYTWVEKGEALGVGDKGAFDSHAVFTPNILKFNGKYYLYYTGVKPTPGNPDNRFENNSETDVTAIGVAVSDSPDGPFRRFSSDPILEISSIEQDFDSYRVDDAAMLVRNGKIWLYYKGRSIIHGQQGPGLTRNGVAFSNMPEGPFTKYDSHIIDKSHEVLIWNQGGGIATLASISRSVYFAPDGLHFSPVQSDIKQFPQAPGLYRPHLSDHTIKEIPGWGISHRNKDGDIYLVRFEMKSKKN
jgi:predicted GH43/DUF377 family glycosyl hydrolase